MLSLCQSNLHPENPTPTAIPSPPMEEATSHKPQRPQSPINLGMALQHQKALETFLILTDSI